MPLDRGESALGDSLQFAEVLLCPLARALTREPDDAPAVQCHPPLVGFIVGMN
jgi:hypothetical protein